MGIEETLINSMENLENNSIHMISIVALAVVMRTKKVALVEVTGDLINMLTRRKELNLTKRKHCLLSRHQLLKEMNQEKLKNKRDHIIKTEIIKKENTKTESIRTESIKVVIEKDFLREMTIKREKILVEKDLTKERRRKKKKKQV
jgi:UDP-N-acetylmuramate-alanine ligase